MLTSEAWSHYLEIYLTFTHIRAFFNKHCALDFNICGTFFLEGNTLIDAVRPLKAKARNTTLPTASVLKESLVSILVYISDNIVEHYNNQVEIVCKPFKLLDVFQHK